MRAPLRASNPVITENTFMKKLLTTVVASLTLAGLLASTAQAEPQVGDTAPAFSLKASDGKTYSLADYKGKQVVVLAWFPKAFTPGCTAECSSMRLGQIKEGYDVPLLGGRNFSVKESTGSGLDKLDVAFFTISVDDAETQAKFAEALKLDYPVLADPTKETAKAYGVVDEKRPYAQRWTFYIGKDGKILHVDKKVNAATHSQDVAAKLKELGVKSK